MRIIATLLLLVLLGSLTMANQHPNIILIVADDHGTDALGCYGNPVIKTPNLDKLADEGTRFTNAYCTSASCAASRSVILTGKYGHATGSYGHVHDYHHFSSYDTIQSLPVLLGEAGYKTARIGKYHLAPESVFDFDEVYKVNPRSTGEMAEQCKKLFAQEKPFFLYFCTDDPHRGAPFKPEKWDDPNYFGNRSEGYPGIKPIKYHYDEVLVPDFLPDTRISREELAEYYQSVSRIDQGVGKLLGLLDDAGKTKETIVIYISDNGIAFPGAKTTVYEAGIKLPCIIKDPFNAFGTGVNDAFISWVDLTPTILDFAGIDPAQNFFHGRSFKGVLHGEETSIREAVYASHVFHEITMYYPMRTVRVDSLKLIWNLAWQLPYPFASDLWASSTWQEIHRAGGEYYGPRLVDDYLQRSEFELYNLNQDPNEVHNVVDDPIYNTHLELLKTQLKQFQQKTKDPWLILWDNDAILQGSGVGL